uniref:hypothetical protein n=1 Tax=Nonomuraea gerenzanensis TaxID=93944 RepID=UPI00287F6EA3|nr:hypothetical protein [Nonomuraea gerenzanensis]
MILPHNPPESTELRELRDDRSAGSAVYRSYHRLLKNHWLGNGACWTVIVPDDGNPLTLTEIGDRLSGGESHVAQKTARPVNAFPGDEAWAVLVGRSGSVTELFEYGFHAAFPPVLPRLSEGGRAYSVHWNVNGNNRIAFAADGELLLAVDAMYPGSWTHEANLAHWPELTAMAPHFRWRNGKSWRAASLATIELTTGCRLSQEWLEQERPHLTGQRWGSAARSPSVTVRVKPVRLPESHPRSTARRMQALTRAARPARRRTSRGSSRCPGSRWAGGGPASGRRCRRRR